MLEGFSGSDGVEGVEGGDGVDGVGGITDGVSDDVFDEVTSDEVTSDDVPSLGVEVVPSGVEVTLDAPSEEVISLVTELNVSDEVTEDGLDESG